MVSSGVQASAAVVVWSGAQGLAVVAVSSVAAALSAVQAVVGKDPLPPSAPYHDDRPDDDSVVVHAVVDVDVDHDVDDDVKQELLLPSTAEIGAPRL